MVIPDNKVRLKLPAVRPGRDRESRFLRKKHYRICSLSLTLEFSPAVLFARIWILISLIFLCTPAAAQNEPDQAGKKFEAPFLFSGLGAGTLPAYLDGFIAPLKGASIPGDYRLLPNAKREYRNGLHEGIDFLVPAGTPVLASKAGWVTRITGKDYDETSLEFKKMLIETTSHLAETPRDVADFLLGRHIVLDHGVIEGQRITTTYSHLRSITEGLQVGSYFQQGTVIGEAGNSGTTNGETGQDGILHFEIRVDGEYLGKGQSADDARLLYERVLKKADPPFADSPDRSFPQTVNPTEQIYSSPIHPLPPRTSLPAPEVLSIREQSDGDPFNQTEKADTGRESQRFGLAFFEPARRRILEMEKRIISGQSIGPSLEERDALMGFVGPLEMVTSPVSGITPHRYLLSPGDKVRVSYWGPMVSPQTLVLSLDQNGEITVPQAGRIVARGMTIEVLQSNLKTMIQRVTVKDIELLVTLDRLKSIQIFVTGEAFRPGSYAVSSVTTLFNALHACGGPSDKGSLRDIRLLRNNDTIRIDFYRYLMEGNGADDLPLQVGDIIFIAPLSRSVSIEGEVMRPGAYELKDGENLKNVVILAGGFRPSAVLGKIQVRTLSPNREWIVKDVDMTSPQADAPLFNGDSVVVQPILPEIKNIVTVEGKVERPGVYEWKDRIRVSDLFSGDNRLLGEACLDRADLLRMNADRKTTTLIPVNLKKALEKDVLYDIELHPLDALVVYSDWDVRFRPPRLVTVLGAVQRPSNYERPDGMTVKDLIVKAGGVMPNAYLERADLVRYDFARDATILIPVDLGTILESNRENGIVLEDKDVLRIYAIRETKFTPPRVVTIFGAVQAPGTYTRSEGMKLKDLLFAAGGTVPGFFEKADLARVPCEGSMRIIEVDVPGLINGDPRQDLLLEDQDVFMIRKRTEFFDHPLYVTITGEVRYPGTYALRSRSDRLSDLVKRAGGLTDRAYPFGAVFMRKSEHSSTREQGSDLVLANQVVDMINELEYERKAAKNHLLILKERGDKDGNLFQRRPPIISDDIEKAFGLGMAPEAAEAASQSAGGFLEATAGNLPSVVSKPRKFGEPELKPSERVIIDMPRILSNSGGREDIVLAEGDTLKIPVRPSTVSVVGAVIRPSTIAHMDGKDLKYYLERSGEATEDGNREKAMVLKADGSIMPGERLNKIAPGDMIYVPSKVMSLEVVDRTDKIIQAVKFGVVATGLFWLIALLI